MRVPIKPFDAAWFFVEKPNAPAHFGPLVILSKPPGAPEDFIRNLVREWRECRHFAPPFNYRLSGKRFLSWEVLGDDDIDLDYHFRHSALPKPGDERELGVLVSRLHTHRLDRRRPLWELHVIEGLEGDRFAIYLKLHHGQMDGMAASRLMERVFSTDPHEKSLEPPWYVGMQSHSQNKDKQRSKLPVKVSGLRDTLSNGPRVLKALAKLGQDAYSGRHPEVAAPFQAPKTIFNRRIGPQRRFATQRYELERLKHVARAGGVKINDVFLAISGAAMRRYLLELDALPERSLIGQVPVSIRPGGDASVGNALAFVYASLGTDIADPLERLQAVHESTSAAKRQHESLPAQAMEPYTMALMGPYIATVIMDLGGYLRPAANLVISNITGPKHRLYFNGARVEHIYGPSVLFHGQALNITMASYADEVNIGYTGCRDSLPSMQNLAVYTGEALEELEAVLGIE